MIYAYGLFCWGVVWLLIIGMLALAVIVMLKSDARSRTVQRNTILIARADEQHAQLMDGNECGLYGQFPPVGLDE